MAVLLAVFFPGSERRGALLFTTDPRAAHIAVRVALLYPGPRRERVGGVSLGAVLAHARYAADPH